MAVVRDTLSARVGGSGRPLLGTVPGPELRGVSSP